MKFAGRTTTAIIPFSPNKILLIKRRTVPFCGFWALPGGRVDPGETVEQTIVREVKEETGLDVKIVRKIGEYHEQGVQDGVEYDYYPACFLVNVVGGEIRRQESEIDEIKLFSVSELPEILAFEHAQMIKDYLAKCRRNAGNQVL
ncbi:MAG: NUDIX hydrolase [Candidatus Bathyarchaeota archaeon]|nr:NUDIX hydrolase [Candidatus Bathyarchaeota archaeon]